MRHSNKVKKLSRKRKVRKGLVRGLTYALLRDGKIKTTEAKAKAMRPAVERLITIAKEETLSSRRLLLTRLPNRRVTKSLAAKIAPRYADRKGGYTRIIKVGRRVSDGARMAIIELV
ncbi:MAG: 50S ribosomal protein L17 [bacterium]|nr:50S ribosomal protein L17 [bacterium]